MPFVQAKCESCGAILTVDSNLKAANCTYCGAAYVVQDSINYYNSFTKVEHMHADVVNVSDESTSEGRKRAADAYMKIGKFEKAELEYAKATELTPQNYKGWLGLIESRTKKFTKRNKSASELRILSDYAKSVRAFAPDDSSKALLEKYESYKNGEITKNTNDINAYNKAIADQTATWNQYDGQKNGLTEKFNHNETRIEKLTRMINEYEKNSHTVAEVIWLLVLLLIGIIGCIVNLAFGIVHILGAGIPAFLLIFGMTRNSARQNERNRLRDEQAKLNIQINETKKYMNAVYSAIETNKRELAKYK